MHTSLVLHALAGRDRAFTRPTFSIQRPKEKVEKLRRNFSTFY